MNKQCYLCGCKNLKEIKKGVRDNAELNVLKCENCGLEFLSSFEHIDNTFYQNGEMHSKISIKNWMQNTKPDDERRYNHLKKQITNKKLLDFGSGSGAFLILAQDVAKTFGVEIDKSLTEHYKENHLNVKTSLDEVNEKFDYITMFHVLEHLKNPHQVLSTLSEKLAKNGKIIVEIPNSNDALLTTYENKAFKNFTYWSCHLFCYNEQNIKKVFEKAGLKINKIEQVQRYPITNHLGWLIDQKEGGHKRLAKYNYKWINLIYIFSLKLFRKTDTLIITASK